MMYKAGYRGCLHISSEKQMSAALMAPQLGARTLSPMSDGNSSRGWHRSGRGTGEGRVRNRLVRVRFMNYL